MRPGKGLGAVERLRGGVTGVGGIGRAAAGSDGHTQESMRNTHSRAISASWEKTRLDTIAKSPHIGGERGIVPDWRAIELPAGWRYTTSDRAVGLTPSGSPHAGTNWLLGRRPWRHHRELCAP